MFRIFVGLLLIWTSHPFQLPVQLPRSLRQLQSSPPRLPPRLGQSSYNAMLNKAARSSQSHTQGTLRDPMVFLQHLWIRLINVRGALLKWWRGVWFKYFATYSVYVLALEGGKYYVGSSSQKRKRFAEHMSHRGGSSWTRDHKPLRMVESVDHLSSDACLGVEATKTAQYMWRYGVNSVRGAYFCQRQPYTAPEDVLALTGFLGHFNGLKYSEVAERLEKSLPELSSTDKGIASVKGDTSRRRRPPKNKRKSPGPNLFSGNPSMVGELKSLEQPHILVQLENRNITTKDLKTFDGKNNIRHGKVERSMPVKKMQALEPITKDMVSANHSKTHDAKIILGNRTSKAEGYASSLRPSVPANRTQLLTKKKSIDKSNSMTIFKGKPKATPAPMKDEPPLVAKKSKTKAVKKRKALKNEKKHGELDENIDYGSKSHFSQTVERHGANGDMDPKQQLASPAVITNTTLVRSLRPLNTSSDVNAAEHIRISITISLPTYKREGGKFLDLHINLHGCIEARSHE